jgi:hypothetical protein
MTLTTELDGANEASVPAQQSSRGARRLWLPRTSFVLRRLSSGHSPIACRRVVRRRFAAPLVPISPPRRAPRCAGKSSRSDTNWPSSIDRILWAWLSHAWDGWRSAVHIVTPETIITWHRRGFRPFWTWRSRHRTGCPGVPPDVRALFRELSTANPLWGAPRIHGALLKLGSR